MHSGLRTRVWILMVSLPSFVILGGLINLLWQSVFIFKRWLIKVAASKSSCARCCVITSVIVPSSSIRIYVASDYIAWQGKYVHSALAEEPLNAVQGHQTRINFLEMLAVELGLKLDLERGIKDHSEPPLAATWQIEFGGCLLWIELCPSPKFIHWSSNP